MKPRIARPIARPTIVRFGERRVVDARAAELLLQAPRDLEDAALALDLAEVLLARDVGDVLAEDEDLLIAPHLVLHAGVEQIDHRRLVAGELRIVLGVELLARRIDVGRVDEVVDRLRARAARRASASSVAASTIASTSSWIFAMLGLGRVALGDEPLRELRHRIARGVGLALVGRTVHHLVVRQRVRVRTNHVRVHERRALPLARVVDRALHRLVAGEQIAAVDFLDVQIREATLTSFEMLPPAVFTSTGTEIA